MNADSDRYRFHRLGIILKFIYALVGLLLGLACILAGVVLGLAGVSGHTSWTASVLGLSTNMTDAGPGVVVFVVGVFMVLITRLKVREEFTLPPQQPVATPMERGASHLPKGAMPEDNHKAETAKPAAAKDEVKTSPAIPEPAERIPPPAPTPSAQPTSSGSGGYPSGGSYSISYFADPKH